MNAITCSIRFSATVARIVVVAFVVFVAMLTVTGDAFALSSTNASPCYAEEGVCSEGGVANWVHIHAIDEMDMYKYGYSTAQRTVSAGGDVVNLDYSLDLYAGS